MKTAVSVPDQVFAAADRLAKRKGISRSQLYSQALQDYLKRNRDDGVTEAINAVVAKHDLQLDPVLQAVQLRQILKNEW